MSSLSESKLESLSSDPANTVLRWAEPGAARPDALKGHEVLARIESLKQDIIAICKENPQGNDFFLRYHLIRKDEGWAEFATHYPIFWAKLTSSACTRQDVVTIHMMVDTRISFEEGRIADEKEVEAVVQNNLLALNFNAKGSGSGSGGTAMSDQQMRQLREQARLRKRMLHKLYENVVVPNEVLGRQARPTSLLGDIVSFFEKEKDQRRKAALEKEIPPAVLLLARRFLEVRAGIAEKCQGLPDSLQSKGLNFMPTFARSAQVEIAFGEPYDVRASFT
jgi:hypothetical protein